MKNISLYVLIIALLTGCTGGSGWTDLFNGEDFTGWVKRNGDADYVIENGEIVGIARAGADNTFLCTEKEYGDFILEFELKVDTSLNSGVQIRSNSRPEYRNGRVHGYQIEVDPSSRGWSAGIYDEGRYGWLYPVSDLNPAAVTAFKNHEWNHYRIEAIGTNIKTWLNGIPVADLLVDHDDTGFIGLQVHSINVITRPWTEGATVRWRNLRIMTKNLKANRKTDTPPIYQANVIPYYMSEREKAEGWTYLFDGQSTDQWRSARGDAMPEHGWVLDDGALMVLPKDEGGGGGDILTIEKFDNFDFKFDFKISEGANSGVKYFVTKDVYARGVLGLEYQILDDAKHPDASRGIQGNRKLASLYDILPTTARVRFTGVNQWNSARIVANNNKVEHWLNHVKVLEYERGSSEYREAIANSKFAEMDKFGEAPEGHILLQDHNDRVWYRNIKIKKL